MRKHRLHRFIKKITQITLLGYGLWAMGYGLSFAEEEKASLPQLPQTDVRISMDFRDADLKDILKILSQQSGINFIPSEDVQDKKITLYLENVPVKDAIDSIIAANALTYEQGPDKNIFIVRPSGVVKVKTITKVYTLNFAQVAPLIVQAVRAPSIGGGTGTTSSTGYSGTSYGTGYGTGASSGTSYGTSSYGTGASYSEQQTTPSEIIQAPGGIREILEKLLTPAGKIVVDQRTNSLIITDIPEQFALIEDIILKLDTPTPQVFIEAEIIETSLDVTNKLGLEYGGTTGTWSATFTGPKKSYSFPYESQAFKGHGAASTFTFGTMTFGDLSFTLKALTSHADTKYLARPKLLTLNNETAVIDITSDAYVGSVTTAEPQTATTTTSAERMTVGVSLRVTPQINAAEYVTMILEPAVSRTEASSVNAGFLNPIRRSARAKVMVKDGETIFIGGLLDTQRTDTKRKVPILGNVPLMGALFKSDTVTDKQTEILIFITPHIVKSSVVQKAKIVSQDKYASPEEAARAKAIEATVMELKKGKNSSR